MSSNFCLESLISDSTRVSFEVVTDAVARGGGEGVVVSSVEMPILLVKSI